MKKVLMIAGVIVLLLGTVVLWLSMGPSPEPPDAGPSVATSTSPIQQQASGGKAKTDSDSSKTGLGSTQPTIAHTPEAEKDSGFRPITELNSEPNQPQYDAAKSASAGSGTHSSGEQQPSSGTTPDGSFPEPSMHAAGGGSGDSPGLPPKPNLTPAVPNPAGKTAPTADTLEPPANDVAPAPKRIPPVTAAGRPLETEPPPPKSLRAPGTIAPKKQARPSGQRQRPPAPPGRYETITTATARTRADHKSPVVDRIRRGTILNVTGSDGDWLVVYSKRKNITVYVRRDEAMLSRRPPPLSTDVPEHKWPEVEQAIRQAFVRNNVLGIQATFIGDTAYLKGTVKSDRERERAEIFARSVLEVKHVFNGIRVE